AYAFACIHMTFVRMTGIGSADYLEAAIFIAYVTAAQGIAIHGRIVVSGDIDRRDDISGQYAIERATDSYFFNGIDRLNEAMNDRLGILYTHGCGIMIRQAAHHFFKAGGGC